MRNLVETRAAPGLDADQWYEIGYDALITTAVMTAALVPALVLERAKRVDNKAVSYAMSLACSFAMTVSGACTAVPTFAGHGFDIIEMLVDSRFDRFMLTFFSTYLVLDLVYGVALYRRQIDMLTGWVHHAAYLWLMAYLHWYHIPRGFSLFLIEELPTSLLALGNVARGWRTNILFGASFASTRLLWHGMLLIKFWNARSRTDLTLWPPIAVTMALHVHWFSGFVAQQLRRARRSARARA